MWSGPAIRWCRQRSNPTMWNSAATALINASISSSKRCDAVIHQRRLRTNGCVGTGMAMGMLDTIPPHGHVAEARIRLCPGGDYELSVGTAEFGNGTATVHRQIAAAALATTPERIRLRPSDTQVVDHDTGAFGSTGTVVAGTATQRAAEALAARIVAIAARHAGADAAACRLERDGVAVGGSIVPLAEIAAAAGGVALEASRSLRRHAALGRLQCAGLQGRGASGDGRASDSPQRPCSGCRDGHQPGAMPRTGRGRRDDGDRRRAL